MPACATYNGHFSSSDSSTNKRSLEPYFQRKKVGSIRDNPKLLKIRQQFENACRENTKFENKFSTSSRIPTSLSLSLSKNSGSVVLEELLKINAKFSNKTEILLKNHVDLSQNRRHSEGEIKDDGSKFFITKEILKPSSMKEQENESLKNSQDIFKNAHLNLESNKFKLSNSKFNNKKESNETKDSFFDNSSSESGIQTCSEDSSSSCKSKHDNPPPIPKRGLSANAAQKSFHSQINQNKKSQNSSKNNSVTKTIQMYEGMFTNENKTKTNKNHSNYPKTTIRKDHDKKSNIPRRNSRRNSMRKSKTLTDKQELNKLPLKNKNSTKEDNGLVLSDEDKSQSIYQTLSTVVTLSPNHDDHPYDRLNRIHDVGNRIHKGQISSCAACKAIPSSALQYRDNESSLLQVKCNESSPHHHPPCICFSCQHSTFTCSQNEPISPTNSEDSLYYNVCCLNPPNRENWRQSRRRPICEQNGRLCVVNCDIERSVECQDIKNNEEFYEKLTEWQSTPVNTPRLRHISKHLSGDSCDSDEGWVDVTDSEDEKFMHLSDRSLILHSNDSIENSTNKSAHKSSFDLEQIVVKCMDINISRSSSAEHLYESIAEIDSQDQIGNHDETNAHSSNGSSTLSLKSEHNAENELDSGEWSTESASPIFDEFSLHNEHDYDDLDTKTSLSSNQSRFTLNSECQETAKKNFMKSVLGKKVVNPKKRRMSNFFVPWLVSNQEYNIPSPTENEKNILKKQNQHNHDTLKERNSAKNKRSQSMPSCVPGLGMSCAKLVFSSDVLDSYKNEISETEQETSKALDNTYLNIDTTSLSHRSSVASSTYIRADQLQTLPSTKGKTVSVIDNATDVTVERIRRRPSSGDSEHSYILFQPIKEEEVPLYQFYERNIKERVSFCRSPNSMSPIMWSSSSENTSFGEMSTKPVRPQLSVVEQLSPDAKDMKMLWCELPEVKDSGILERISAQELKLQEAAFEFIQSQASYIRSLKVLYEQFIKTPEFSEIKSSTCVLSKHEHDVLFADIVRIKEISEKLMADLTNRWSDGILIPDICDIIHQYAIMPAFSIYVKYCSNRVYQERTLKELKETRLCFLEVLRKLESNPACQGLSLESFLFLPMQHIARLPLSLDNIYRWLAPESPSYNVCKLALEAVHKIFMKCNEGARKMERLEEMFVLNKQLEFKECKVIPLISASRWLLKKGELVKLEFDKKTFGRSSRCVRVPIYIFLFNDLLVVTKRKNEDSYMVVDYCSREKVKAQAVNAKDLQQPVVVPNTCRYLLYLTLFHNHQGSTVDMILNCTLLSERTRWIEAIHSVSENKPCEVWEYDCAQVQCVRSYIAQQPDELSLQESDVITIHRKMNDGWYEGRRLRDGLQGWFPASYTMDIPCSRARASNLRQCYRLLMLSQTK